MTALPLALSDYKRYGRQMILDGFGLEAQLKLKNAKAIVVGAGGLGCPVLQYLGAAGLGRIGIVDHDRVEVSNLQRQILHTESRVGWYKAESAAQALRENNSSLHVDVFTEAITPHNARMILGGYDLILDCTDNAPARYLLNDTAVALGKPLISGAALKYDGQLVTYNLSPNGPCYRCLFPTPPSPQSMRSCEENGVLGVVTGIIGSLQALEAIKLITGHHDEKPTMLIFSALAMPPFRSVKLRTKRANCTACGSDKGDPKMIEETDYVAFCGGSQPDWETAGLVPGKADERMSVQNLHSRLADTVSPVLLVDVRTTSEFSICHLPSSHNIPLSELLANPAAHLDSTLRPPLTQASLDHATLHEESPKAKALLVCICKRGNDSQLAASALRSIVEEKSLTSVYEVKDVVGGLRAWSRDVDPNFPVY